MTHHHRHAAGVRTQVDRREAGVAGDAADLERVDPKYFGHARGEYVIGALADLGGAAEHRHLPAAIDEQLHARVRHLVPVDRQARAAQVRRAGDADAATVRQLAVLVLPVGALDHAADAFGQPDGADLQPVGGERVGLGDDLQAQLGRVELELLGDLVELHFLAEARLRRAVAAFGAARRLVGERAARVEFVARQLVGHRLQHAGVERAGRAVRAVAAAIEQRLQMHAGERAVLVHAGAHFHQHGVPPAMHVEHFLAVEADLYRTAEIERRLGDHDFMVVQIALAAESPTVRTGDHTDMRSGHLQRLGHRAMDVVRHLRARPHRELAFGVDGGHRRVLLHRQMGIALVEERVLEHVVGFRERVLDVAEFVALDAVHVAEFAIFVQARLGVGQRFLGARDRG